MVDENRKPALGRSSCSTTVLKDCDPSSGTGAEGGSAALLGNLTFSQDVHMAHELVCLFLAIDDPDVRERCLDFVREQAAANDH